MPEPPNSESYLPNDIAELGVRILSKPKMIDMIIMMYSKGVLKQNDLRQRFGQNHTIVNLNIMKTLELAEDHFPPSDQKGYKARWWRLTNRGRWLASTLLDIDGLVSGETSLDELTDDLENYEVPLDVIFERDIIS